MVISANGSKGHHTFTLNVTETSTSTQDNLSYISYSFVLSPIQNGWDWYGWGSLISYSISIGDNTYTGAISSYDGSSTVTLSSGNSIPITHNSDGTKTISVSFNVTDASGQSYTCGNASSSGTMALTNLHKPPVINVATMVETNSVLTALNVPDTTIVQYLSKKTITLSATAYDSATLTYRLRHFNTNYVIPTSGYQSSNIFNTDYTQNDVNISNGKANIIQDVLDSLNGSATDWLNVTINGANQRPNGIAYTKPTLENTSTTIKRKTDSNTTLTDNKAVLNLVGTIYKTNDVIGNNNSIAEIGYKIWERDTSEPVNYTSLVPTIIGGNVTITNLEISNLLYTKVYDYKIILTDAYGYSKIVEGSLPTGVSVWSEYKNRVDFLKLTVGGYNPFEYSENETKCGVWIDGKPIYRKVITETSIITGGETVINPDISNIDEYVTIRGILYKSDGTAYTLPRTHHRDITYSANIYISSDNNIRIEVGSSLTNISGANIILEYTKNN